MLMQNLRYSAVLVIGPSPRMMPKDAEAQPATSTDLATNGHKVIGIRPKEHVFESF